VSALLFIVARGTCIFSFLFCETKKLTLFPIPDKWYDTTAIWQGNSHAHPR